MIEQSLLRAVVADVVARELSGLREGGEKNDGRNVRTGFGLREMSCVSVEETRDGLIVALTEEVRFADGFVGEGRLKPERSGRKQQGGHHDGKKRTVERIHVFTLP